MIDTSRLTVLIASYLEPDLVERIRSVDARLEVLYEPDLLRPPKYAADHVGVAVQRSTADEARWRSLLGRADVMFDFDHSHLDDLPELAPDVRWVQATSAGIGQRVAELRYAERMPETVFTTASGVHAVPLAEFCVLGMIAFSRRLFQMVEQQRAREWTRFAGSDLRGRTLAIYGYGSIGIEVARLACALGMRVHGIRRTSAGSRPGDPAVVELHPAESLPLVLPSAEFFVVAVPHTPQTEGAIGAAELALLPEGAVVINVGRGPVIDEPALIEALQSGHLRGAVLDVFATEPLPTDSPLWEMPNVLISPHSASTSDRENERITDLFCDNLRRYLDGEPLHNVLDPERRY